MQQQTSIFQTPEDKLRRRLAMTHQQRLANALRMLRVMKMLQQAKKIPATNEHS